MKVKMKIEINDKLIDEKNIDTTDPVSIVLGMINALENAQEHINKEIDKLLKQRNDAKVIDYEKLYSEAIKNIKIILKPEPLKSENNENTD